MPGVGWRPSEKLDPEGVALEKVGVDEFAARTASASAF
jgi:hypothetical protein